MAVTAPRHLATGDAGFIGSHIVHRLVAQGASVRVVDNLSTGMLSNLDGVSGDVDFVRGDLANPAIAERPVEDVEVVFHLAALGSVPRAIADAWDRTAQT